MSRALQQGVALIQVLIIVGIISVFVLYISSSAREQVKLAQVSQDKAKAHVLNHQAEADILFNLMTNPLTLPKPGQSLKGVKSKWNFHSLPFQLSAQTQATMQDHAGLLNLLNPNPNLMRDLLIANGVDSSRAATIVASVLDWLDRDDDARHQGMESSQYGYQIRNEHIADLSELKKIASLSQREYTLLRDNLSLDFAGQVNLTNAPSEILNAVIGKGLTEQVNQLRNSRQLTENIFEEITGKTQDDYYYYYPSNFFNISIQSKVAAARVEKHMTIEISPYGTKDLVTWLAVKE